MEVKNPVWNRMPDKRKAIVLPEEIRCEWIGMDVSRFGVGRVIVCVLVLGSGAAIRRCSRPV